MVDAKQLEFENLIEKVEAPLEKREIETAIKVIKNNKIMVNDDGSAKRAIIKALYFELLILIVNNHHLSEEEQEEHIRNLNKESGFDFIKFLEELGE